MSESRAVPRNYHGGFRPAARRGGLALVVAIMLIVSLTTAARAVYQPGEPPGVDPGVPVFGGAANPVPARPAAFDPSRSMLQAMYDADLAAGGTSFWFDRILARPFLSDADPLMTRGRALFMYSHSAATL